jgi:hypothetical protein
MGASATLKKFAKSRERAYLQYGCFTMARAKAVTRIIQVADFNSRSSDQVQLRAVTQVESQIREILPGEDSRYKSMRGQMLTLLAESQQLNAHASTRNPVPLPTHAGGDRHAQGNHGTQLSFI